MKTTSALSTHTPLLLALAVFGAAIGGFTQAAAAQETPPQTQPASPDQLQKDLDRAAQNPEQFIRERAAKNRARWEAMRREQQNKAGAQPNVPRQQAQANGAAQPNTRPRSMRG